MRNRSENGVIESRKGTGSEREVEQRPIFVPSALQPYVAAFSLSLSPAVIFVMSECENHPSWLWLPYRHADAGLWLNDFIMLVFTVLLLWNKWLIHCFRLTLMVECTAVGSAAPEATFSHLASRHTVNPPECWKRSYRTSPEALRIWAQFPVCHIQCINSGLLFFLCVVSHFMDNRTLNINEPLTV